MELEPAVIPSAQQVGLQGSGSRSGRECAAGISQPSPPPERGKGREFPGILNSEFSTWNSKPGVLSLEFSTWNSQPGILSLEFSTWNSQPEILNLEFSAWNASPGSTRSLWQGCSELLPLHPNNSGLPKIPRIHGKQQLPPSLCVFQPPRVTPGHFFLLFLPLLAIPGPFSSQISPPERAATPGKAKPGLG